MAFGTHEVGGLHFEGAGLQGAADCQVSIRRDSVDDVICMGSILTV